MYDMKVWYNMNTSVPPNEAFKFTQHKHIDRPAIMKEIPRPEDLIEIYSVQPNPTQSNPYQSTPIIDYSSTSNHNSQPGYLMLASDHKIAANNTPKVSKKECYIACHLATNKKQLLTAPSLLT